MIARSSANATTESLIDQLKARLADRQSLDEPYVLEDRIPQTQSRHVVVIWDAWSDYDRSARSAVIMDAFEQSGVLKGDTVRVALGLTQQEALDMGYLPFKIVGTRRKSDSVSPSKLKEAMNSVGGVRHTTGDTSELRFPSQELAEEAYRLLASKVAGPYWAIVHEVRD